MRLTSKTANDNLLVCFGVYAVIADETQKETSRKPEGNREKRLEKCAKGASEGRMETGIAGNCIRDRAAQPGKVER